ncbi:MAG: cell wall metabolism sensor histidine kinase WalK, partial [Caldilineaceae bacterium]|nr:cell wall metabolism sensor histidine kinase WalK [Caldilineaceae bacterium]
MRRGAGLRNRAGGRNQDPRPPDPRLRATLVDSGGNVLFSSRPELIGTRLTLEAIEQGVPIHANDQVVGVVLFEGRPTPLPIEAPESAFLARVNRAIALGALGATAVALILGVLLARTITRPVRELTAATQSVAQGSLGEQVPVRSRDELGELALSFNQMSSDLS